MNVVVGSNVPLIRVVRQAERNVEGSHGCEICWKCGGREEPGVLLLHLGYRQDVRGWIRRRWRLLEEGVGKAVRKVLLNELNKVLGLYCGHIRSCIGRG